MKCSECVGNIVTSQHTLYRTDGGSSGNYDCQKCGKRKSWSIPGYMTEEVIDMSDSSSNLKKESKEC